MNATPTSPALRSLSAPLPFFILFTCDVVIPLMSDELSRLPIDIQQTAEATQSKYNPKVKPFNKAS